MNQKSLDKLLRQITEHEKEYQLGKSSEILKHFPKVTINGEEILKIDIKYIENAVTPIFVKKHSRFQTFPFHVHEGIEINYMYSGSCTQIINETTQVLQKGQVLFLNSDIIHTVEPLGENDILINIFIDKDYLSSNFFNRFSSESILTNFFFNAITTGVTHNNYLLFKSENSQRLTLFMNEFLCEWFNPSYSSVDIQNSLFTLIISELLNVYQKTLAEEDNSFKNSSIISILHYIETNFRTCSLASVASFFNMNANYLSNLLKKHTGYSYRELIQQQRMKTAEQLLRNTKLSVTEIANYVGYENISFFYQVFQKQYHCLPGDYRKNAVYYHKV